MSKATKISYSYTPFGELLSGITAKTTFFAYNGESYDSATGMVNLRARWYEPAMMRFNQRDILRGDQSAGISLNRYLYCENDPVNFVDPSGKTLAELWNKAKAAVSNGVSAAKKVATAAYNAGKTLVSSAVQQVATVVKPVVNKVVNTVKEVATVAKTQGIVAAAKTLASNAASVPAYVKNVVNATVVERQSIQVESAQQIANTAKGLDKDLLSIGKDTYETLSPRNQKIIDYTARTVNYMQQNGASQAAIDRVIRGACTQIAKNVGETFAKGVYEAVIPEPVRIDIANFDPNNTDERVALDAKVFSMYKEKLVLKLPIGANAFSLGAIFLGDEVGSAKYIEQEQTVQHEYGHTQQLEQLGLQDYLLLVAIPSVTANVLDRMRMLPYDYYSSPWEYEADLSGGVVSQELQSNLYSRDYESWAGAVNLSYNIATKAVSNITP